MEDNEGYVVRWRGKRFFGLWPCWVYVKIERVFIGKTILGDATVGVITSTYDLKEAERFLVISEAQFMCNKQGRQAVGIGLARKEHGQLRIDL